MQTADTTIMSLVEQMPNADSPGAASKFTGPKPEEAHAIVAQILTSGRNGLETLIDLVRDRTDPQFKNYKPEYTLHCVALYVLGKGREANRKVLIELLCQRIGNEKLTKWQRGFFIRTLQVVGDSSAADALGAQLLDDDLCEYATQALIAICHGAAAQLRKALPKATGGRMTIVQALGVLRDAAAVPMIKEAITSTDTGVRMAATWALASIGDASAMDAVMKAADTKDRWERIQAAKACLVLAERLKASGKDDAARSVYAYLADSRKGPGESYIHEQATKALGSASSASEF